MESVRRVMYTRTKKLTNKNAPLTVMELWSVLLLGVFYVLNRIIKFTSTKTPFEIFYGRKSNPSNLCLIRCLICHIVFLLVSLLLSIFQEYWQRKLNWQSVPSWVRPPVEFSCGSSCFYMLVLPTCYSDFFESLNDIYSEFMMSGQNRWVQLSMRQLRPSDTYFSIFSEDSPFIRC